MLDSALWKGRWVMNISMFMVEGVAYLPPSLGCYEGSGFMLG